MTCSVPVALFIFNRPDVTRKTFDAIATAKPARLLVIADGPRDASDIELCEATRRIATHVTWPCELFTEFSDKNLGCRYRMASGLDWVFSICERAILLEDDCVTAQSFFQFCENLLHYYEDDNRVTMIGGSAPRGSIDVSCSYYFTPYTLIWGWATWRRAWKGYDVDMKSWPADKANGLLKSIFDQDEECEHWRRRFDRTYDGHSTWDHQWTLHCWRKLGLSVLPNRNLVTNIGFGPNATHTKSIAASAKLSVPFQELEFPLAHPPSVIRNRGMDQRIYREIFNA